MAFGGDNSQWLDSFPDGLIPDVLRLVLDGWQQMPTVNSDAKEEPTTRQLCAILRRVKRLRELPFSIWPESSEIDPSTGQEIGRIDLLFFPGNREDVYFSFECKRLYYLANDGKTKANVSEYTGNDGMMCYITQKYSKGLPHGGMIGYVLNGRIDKAKVEIVNSMKKNRAKLKLRSNQPFAPCVHFPSDARLAQSVHRVVGKNMIIYHVLLPN